MILKTLASRNESQKKLKWTPTNNKPTSLKCMYYSEYVWNEYVLFFIKKESFRSCMLSIIIIVSLCLCECCWNVKPCFKCWLYWCIKWKGVEWINIWGMWQVYDYTKKMFLRILTAGTGEDYLKKRLLSCPFQRNFVEDSLRLFVVIPVIAYVNDAKLVGM